MMTDKKSRPFVVCHMLCSIDGKIEGNFMSAPESASCIKKYGDLRSTFGCEAVLYGTRTAAESFASGRVSDFQDKRMRLTAKDFVAENDADDYIVAIDADGILSWDGGYVEKKGRPRAHVIEVLTEKAEGFVFHRTAHAGRRRYNQRLVP